jgi:methyltransferase-like protein/cyclopropane fatty-acyl-phospholipid synthase-like methyltransferase
MQSLETKTTDFSEVIHENYALPQAHPDRLATIAKLFGLKTPDIENCRVLQIGYAISNNLIPLALTFPKGQFTGIDLSSKHAEEGKSIISKLAVSNVQIQHLDISQIDKDFGRFDYIIMHGIFSWSSKEQQDKLLSICSSNLSRHGVAYVSYNTYPGWHYRGLVRDMMLYHASQFNELETKVVQARALIGFLAQAVPTENNVYGMMLKDELDMLSHQSDSYILDDHLRRENEPVYFHQFAEQANTHDLQYLGESEFSSMLTSNFAPEVAATLKHVSNDLIRTEQFMDFVRNRAFRQTLLCHKDIKLKRNLQGSAMHNFLFSSSAHTNVSAEQLETTSPVEFTLKNGIALTTTRPVTKLALSYLAQISPQSMSFEELLDNIMPKLPATSGTRQMQEQLLGGDLLTAGAAGVIDLHSYQRNLCLEVSSYPSVSKFARYQAESGSAITNKLHESIDADSFVRTVISLLDGTRDLEKIVAGLEILVHAGALKVQRDNENLEESKELHDTLRGVVLESLNEIKSAVLLDK